MHDVIYHAIQAPLVGLGSGIIPTLIAVFFIQILWFSDCMDRSLSTP